MLLLIWFSVEKKKVTGDRFGSTVGSLHKKGCTKLVMEFRLA